MTTQALYLKYRPRTFEEVVGQEPITRTLRNALREGRVRHAYLFTGPRGTGKTTMARLLAKAVNCEALEGERPCNECSICVAINEGRLLDLIEIDAASNRGIDEIRDIREKVGFRPNQGRYKVYVLDEAHMLTEPAFNALLKTLEEPPPHVIFVLVTTDPHKIPATIASRCQRFDFRRIPLQAILDRLAYIAEREGITVDPAAMELIARQGTGALRDAISLLDQLTSYGDEIRLDQVQMLLGTVASAAAAGLVACLVEGDVAGGLDLINRTVGDGADPRQLGREVVEHLRGLLLIREGAGASLLSATAEQAAEMESLSGRIPAERLLRTLRLFSEAITELKRGLQTVPQLPLEMALVESMLAPGMSQGAGGPLPQQGSEPMPQQPGGGRTTPAPDQAGVKAEVRRVAEQPGPAPGSAQAPAAKVEVQVEEPGSPVPPAASQAPAATPPPAGGLSLAQVEQNWDQLLQAVRQRNPATHAALISGCQPVEVNGVEIVVTFPYPFLREKLGDAQRTTEIQEALDEVLQATCRLKLVLASEYTSQAHPDPAPSGTALGQTAGSQPLGAQELDAISRWAEKRGGQTRIVP